ncbi:glycosyltransferase family 2 protein [Paenibacillus sp. Marseille-Q4541]|uniref:glycosyltransferase family 2 protein n=1 Tax=Paenibacillus sp. Marseille-Q4541 TaxID=2831522 RepID=UPI001BA8FF47
MKILIIIPAYNEERNIDKLLHAIQYKYSDLVDILVVNDCSMDETARICREHGVNLIDLPCNLGIGGAVQTGYKYAEAKGYDIAIQIDGDGQHNPEYIKYLIDPIINGEANLVIGSRYINKEGFQSSAMRRVGISYFSKLLHLLTGQLITDPTSGYRACDKNIIQIFSKRYPVDYPEPESIMFLKRNKFRINEVPVIMEPRLQGASSITQLKSIYYMTKVSLAILIDRMRKQIV